MICVIQRVENAGVGVEGLTVGKCGKGLLILACAVTGDTDETVCKVADKILKMRIFEDEAGKLGKSVTDIGGELLVVSNFTLCGSCRHGTRPDFVKAEKAGNAERLCSGNLPFKRRRLLSGRSHRRDGKASQNRPDPFYSGRSGLYPARGTDRKDDRLCRQPIKYQTADHSGGRRDPFFRHPPGARFCLPRAKKGRPCPWAEAADRCGEWDHRNFCIPSVAWEISALMVTVNLMPFFSPKASSQFRKASVSLSTSRPMARHRLSMNTWEMS